MKLLNKLFNPVKPIKPTQLQQLDSLLSILEEHNIYSAEVSIDNITYKGTRLPALKENKPKTPSEEELMGIQGFRRW